MAAHSKNPEIKKLDFLIGEWKTMGTVKATQSSPEISFKGTDTYEWVAGGAFILHTVNVLMGSELVETVEIIGYESDTKNYSLRSFDNKGNFTTMNGDWNDKRDFVIFGKNMRSTLTVNAKCSEMAASWELLNDIWNPWMDLKLIKKLP